MTGLDRFMVVYERHLREAHAANPAEYRWPIEELPTVLGRMREAIARGSMSKDSPAFKRTCKELGIKYTYTAIREYVAMPAVEVSP